MRKLLMHAPLAVDASTRWTDPHTKANALLQAHFSRTPLQGDLAADQKAVVLQAVRLLQVRCHCLHPPFSLRREEERYPVVSLMVPCSVKQALLHMVCNLHTHAHAGCGSEQMLLCSSF